MLASIQSENLRMISGNIPESLTFWSRGQTKVTQKWDDLESDTKEYIVRPAYVADTKNKKTNKTGQDWANTSMSVWNPTTQKYEKPSIDVEQETRLNKPIDDVRIIALEIRGQGGRAYKVVVDNKYYVDLREDVLLDAMLHEGIGVGGKLGGRYIFAVVGSQMKLVRIGSALYDAVSESTKVGKTKAIKDFEVGGIYARKSGECVYLGVYNSQKVSFSLANVRIAHYNQDVSTPVAANSYGVYHVFLEMYGLNQIDQSFFYCYGLVSAKPESFKTKVGTCEVDAKKLIDRLRESVSKSIFKGPQLHGNYNDRDHQHYALIANLSDQPNYINPVFGL